MVAMSMSQQLVDILQKTVSGSQSDQNLARQFLEQAVEANFVEFIKALADVLVNLSCGMVPRQAAGLQLKNLLSSKDIEVRNRHYQRWLSLPMDVRCEIRDKVLRTLGTEEVRPSIAAQCVAAIACIEVPRQQWDECLGALMRNVTHATSTERLKESSLEAIGYICQDIETSSLGSASNDVLTAIVHGMQAKEPSEHVRHAATVALNNSLEFASRNFDHELERNMIMQVVCEATQSTNPSIKVASLQCLVKIMTIYYQLMESYMAPALFPITVEAMRSTEDDIALQGIEFWTSVCDEEQALEVDALSCAESGRVPDHVSKHYGRGAMPHILPILLETLARQDESADEDDWDPAKAAGVCMTVLAGVVGDDVVPPVLQFVNDNIGSTDWRRRDAAVMAFGSILEGPDSEKLKPLVLMAMPSLINLLDDSNIVVKDTAAWCIGRVCEVVPDTVLNAEVLTPLLPALSSALQQQPRVATNVCWAISGLATAAYDAAADNHEMINADREVTTYILSSVFQAMINELLRTTERPDAAQSNLRIAAYEALIELIKNSPLDCYATVQTTTVVVLERMQRLLAIDRASLSPNDASQLADLQSMLCGLLNSVLRKIKPEDADKVVSLAMSCLMAMLAATGAPAGDTGTSVSEDALMAVSSVIDMTHEKFAVYIDPFKPYLYAALENLSEGQTVSAAVGVVGDLCRNLAEKLLPIVPDIMQRLVAILQSSVVSKHVKPVVLSAFGDIALALGISFRPYLDGVLGVLSEACSLNAAEDDIDAMDFQRDMFESCCEAFTGVIQGLKGKTIPEDFARLQPHIVNLMTLLDRIAEDPEPTDGLLAAACGAVGDMASAFGEAAATSLQRPQIEQLLVKARKSKSHKVKTLANWAAREIKKAKGQTTGATN